VSIKVSANKYTPIPTGPLRSGHQRQRGKMKTVAMLQGYPDQ
jgi:hypothetical protein